MAFRGSRKGPHCLSPEACEMLEYFSLWCRHPDRACTAGTRGGRPESALPWSPLTHSRDKKEASLCADHYRLILSPHTLMVPSWAFLIPHFSCQPGSPVQSLISSGFPDASLLKLIFCSYTGFYGVCQSAPTWNIDVSSSRNGVFADDTKLKGDRTIMMNRWALIQCDWCPYE